MASGAMGWMSMRSRGLAGGDWRRPAGGETGSVRCQIWVKRDHGLELGVSCRSWLGDVASLRLCVKRGAPFNAKTQRRQDAGEADSWIAWSGG